MKRMALALYDLARSVMARPIKPSNESPKRIHWTTFDKPLEQMTEVERRAAAERLANEMLGVIEDHGK